jgi:uncharacterized protein
MRAQTLAQSPPQPLVHVSDRDLEGLYGFLKSDRSPSSGMMLSELDGFLTGISVGPEFVRTSDWLSLISGGDAPAFASADHATTIVAALMRHRDETLRKIADGAFAPVFWTDRGGKIVTADWAGGFVQAMKLRMDAWRSIFASRHSAKYLVPILWHCPDEEGRALLGFGPAADDELVEAVTELIPDSVAAIAGYWRGRPNRSSMTLVPATHGEPHRAGHKIGRNEPCPCGSGQKFKRCCGRAV